METFPVWLRLNSSRENISLRVIKIGSGILTFIFQYRTKTTLSIYPIAFGTVFATISELCLTRRQFCLENAWQAPFYQEVNKPAL